MFNLFIMSLNSVSEFSLCIASVLSFINIFPSIVHVEIQKLECMTDDNVQETEAVNEEDDQETDMIEIGKVDAKRDCCPESEHAFIICQGLPFSSVV
jgi:hypothetical protein